MAAASARAGRKILMVRFGGVKGGGREQFGGHRIAVFPELFHEGKGCGFLPLIFVENRRTVLCADIRALSVDG